MNGRITFAATVLLAVAATAQDPSPAIESAPVPRVVSPPLVAESPAKETPPQPEAPKPLDSRQAADMLSEDELAQAVDLLRNNYIQPGALSDLSLARAGMQGLLDRLGAGARIYSKTPVIAETAPPLRSEILEGTIGYLRLGHLGDLGALDAALEQFSTNPPPALILDLRATPHSTDFDLAAEVCRRFAPKGRILFSIKRPKINDEEILTSREDPRWRGHLVILVDGDTAGASEVIAAVLRTHLRAYVVGQQTKGEAAQFEDLPLGGGKVLRIAVGEVTLPDNSPVFPGGLRPDLVVPVPQEKTNEILLAALTDGAAPLVADPERARMNEAALIAGTNPELDAAQERQKQRESGKTPKPKLRDEVLQRAIDYITSVRIYEAGRPKEEHRLKR